MKKRSPNPNAGWSFLFGRVDEYDIESFYGLTLSDFALLGFVARNIVSKRSIYSPTFGFCLFDFIVGFWWDEDRGVG